MIEPHLIEVNPDRGNIYFSSSRRGNHGDGKLDQILQPLVTDLRFQRLDYPLTVVYGTLETVSSCYAYFSSKLGSEQYEPRGAPKLSRNRLFTQFHAQYPEKERKQIVDGLVQKKSKLRIIFATVAFGIGLDISNIRQVIHIGVPYTMEEFFQEAGRAGRDGLPATAHVYFNSFDISKGKKQLSDVMRDYVQKSKCKREMILSYFGFPVPTRRIALHECCDYHQKICPCDECLVSNVSNLFYENLEDIEQANDTMDLLQPGPKRLSEGAEEQLRDKLNLFRLSLPGNGRSPVGSTSLSTGISIELIEQIVLNACLLTSLEEIETQLPIYSRNNAEAIWNIVEKYVTKS